MSETIDESSLVIHLSNDKMGQLIGHSGQNIRLIEKVCGVEIACQPRTFTICVDDDENVDVRLKCVNVGKSFADKEWAENLHRHLKSATRGGFTKKLTEREFFEQLHGHIVNEEHLEILEKRCNVEILYYNFEGWVYVCVVERMGSRRLLNGLETAIGLVGDWIHARYRDDRCHVPLRHDAVWRKCIPR